MLISMCSPCISGSMPRGKLGMATTGLPSIPISGVRRTAYSTVLVSILLVIPRTFARAVWIAAHRELRRRIVVFYIQGERTTGLLRSAEAAAQREILAQRMPLGVVVRH